jgi:hypothetical protein
MHGETLRNDFSCLQNPKIYGKCTEHNFFSSMFVWIFFFVALHRRVRRISKSECYHHHVCPYISVFSHGHNSAPTGRIFMKINIWTFFANQSIKFEIHWNLTIITLILHEDQYTFWSYVAQFFLEVETFQRSDVERIKNKHFIFDVFLTVHRGIKLFLFTNLMHNSFIL